MNAEYKSFLENKIQIAKGDALNCLAAEVNPFLKPHQKDTVAWAVRGGRRAIFSAFGLGKTLMQLEIVRLVLEKTGGGMALIVCPLGVRQEFKRDAGKIGLSVKFIRTTPEAVMDGIYLTNYESVRDGKIDPSVFKVITLDEAAILRGFGGTKTFRELMATMAGDDRRDKSNPVSGEGIKYRFVATATPSPNEFIELLAYAAFLGVMDVSQAKTRFFKRDSTKADKLTLHPYKEREFWLWVASWAIFVQRPSDLGHSDEGYELPPIDVRWHEVKTDHREAGVEKSGQGRLLRNSALGVQDAAREKRSSLPARIEKLLELRAEDPGAHRLIWHDLEDERRAIEAAVPSAVSIYGSQDLEEREQAVIDFSDGKIQELAAKPVIAGSGCNFQRHCSWAIFLGIGFKFNDFIQAVHRIQRFLQTKPVRIDLIFTEAERDVRASLIRKWEQHNELVANMTAIIREFGLSHASMAGALKRSFGVERIEESGRGWKMVNTDAVQEAAEMAENSVDLMLTSIPFSTQYEYSPSYHDFGHTDNEAHFWRQMDFLTPNLLRTLKPGRNLLIHVKDRIAPGNYTGMGFQTVQPFHADAIYHYRRHGFAYLGMKTIVTDVVRENNQTYRLGWTEQCKDGTRMGVGMPEYLLLFRKPPTDSSNGYADVPVVKEKAKYSRARWQLDAHGFARSSGNRLLIPEDIAALPHEKIYKIWKEHSLTNPYDFAHHVQLGEVLESQGILPVTFMLMPPHSWHPDVWADVARMRTLNEKQARTGKQMHLCPLQFDIVDRAIEQMSQPGEVVFDPFAGIGTVPLRALQLGRVGWGTELSAAYFTDAVCWLKAAEQEADVPELFDLEVA